VHADLMDALSHVDLRAAPERGALERGDREIREPLVRAGSRASEKLEYGRSVAGERPGELRHRRSQPIAREAIGGDGDRVGIATIRRPEDLLAIAQLDGDRVPQEIA
jgi:hypothetical protein